MSGHVKEITKRGRWMYGGTAPSEVWIIKQSYIEGPPIDEEPTPAYPPYDLNGMFYHAAYVRQDAIRGVSNLCGSSDETVLLAERTILGTIVWD